MWFAGTACCLSQRPDTASGCSFSANARQPATQRCRFLDKRDINARIEPGAIIRDQVEIGDNAVIMMGAVINIGAEIGGWDHD